MQIPAAKRLAYALVLAPLLLPAAVSAEVLRVGPGEQFRAPSEAAAMARPGDTVLIAAGRYRDCAIWRSPDLTVAAVGGEAEITGPVCDGKALFVVAAPRVTLRGLAFTGATAPAGNGAGIRAEAADLRVERTRFEGNETGILTIASMPGGTLVIEDSRFRGNGARIPDGPCTGHALYVNHWASLVVRRSRFEDTRHCHHVKSRADRTEVMDSIIADGPEGGSSYLVDLPNGGDLLLAGNQLAKGPRTGNPRVAVIIGAEGVARPTTRLEIRDNRFDNRLTVPTTFVENRSTTPVVLSGNVLSGPVQPLAGPGELR